jgi:hypothetical protein
MSDAFARLTHIAHFHRLAAGGLMILLLAGLLPASLNAAQGGKTEVLPVQKATPAVVFIETAGSEAELRRQLRAKNRVVELGALTPNVLFSEAPTGAYGFVVPKLLGLALVTRSPDIGLQRHAPAANAFEIHKLADGSGMLVGFVAPDLMAQVAPSQRPKNIRLALHSNPSDKATHIVAVPLVKLAADRMPIRLDQNNPDGPVMFDMDLQSSTTRASTQGGP